MQHNSNLSMSVIVCITVIKGDDYFPKNSTNSDSRRFILLPQTKEAAAPSAQRN